MLSETYQAAYLPAATILLLLVAVAVPIYMCFGIHASAPSEQDLPPLPDSMRQAIQHAAADSAAAAAQGHADAIAKEEAEARQKAEADAAAAAAQGGESQAEDVDVDVDSAIGIDAAVDEDDAKGA